ncbi:MAG: 4'-phosphopantetheinyl transferase superfamily protein [Clostridia bacterium]|nr:4'-phosphopantetheinyl transferase superfamily protein [Clostridia bacterium]
MCFDDILAKLESNRLPYSNGFKAWVVDVRSFKPWLDAIKNCLSKEEMIRGCTITNKNAQELFFLRKGIARILIAHFASRHPCEITFERTDEGKPFIALPIPNCIYFNISHSKEYLLVGISENRDIGVDIEKIRQDAGHAVLAESVFSPLEKALYSSYSPSEKLRCFYKAWVQKEAVSKAVGKGISYGFDTLDVLIEPNKLHEEYNLLIEGLELPAEIMLRFEKDYVFAVCML